MIAASILLCLTAASAGDLEDGIALYQNKDYREALAAFGRAGAKKQSAARRAKIHLYIGIIQLRFGQSDDARASFETALDHRAEVTFPDPSQGAAGRLFEAIRAERAPAETAPAKKPPKRKKKTRKKTRRVRPEAEPETETSPAPPIRLEPPPPPPPILEVPVPDTVEDSNVGAWMLTGGAVTLAVVSAVMIVAGRNNGSAALDPSINAIEAEELHSLHRSQIGVGIGIGIAAGITGGLAAYMFAAD